eukprot:GHVU01215476.1.p2 GENE.GHVU01215476.1~~GHVU01215476.1.p2  ORF type:complete len:109 (-),score=8.49 GHVU01215476.1:530-856(-)
MWPLPDTRGAGDDCTHTDARVRVCIQPVTASATAAAVALPSSYPQSVIPSLNDALIPTQSFMHHTGTETDRFCVIQTTNVECLLDRVSTLLLKGQRVETEGDKRSAVE